jgi:hypothetical protein
MVVQVEGIAEAFHLQCLSTNPKTLQEYETVSQISQQDKEVKDWLYANWNAIPINVRNRLNALAR